MHSEKTFHEVYTQSLEQNKSERKKSYQRVMPNIFKHSPIILVSQDSSVDVCELASVFPES